MRFNELIAGVREDLAVKVFGDDFAKMQRTAGRIADVLRKVEGAGNVLSHRLHADIGVQVPADMSVAEADRLAESLRHEMLEHIPALSVATVRVSSRSNEQPDSHTDHHTPAPEPAGHAH